MEKSPCLSPSNRRAQWCICGVVDMGLFRLLPQEWRAFSFLLFLQYQKVSNLPVACRPTEFAAHIGGLWLLLLVGEGIQEGVQIIFFCLQRKPVSFCTQALLKLTVSICPRSSLWFREGEDVLVMQTPLVSETPGSSFLSH